MKSLVPWVCLVAASSAQVAFANNGLDAYRLGDYVQAEVQLATSAVKDPIVDYYMGRMSLYGYGQLKNNALAMRYFQQSAEKGFLPAQHIMGRYALLEDKNPEQALIWFKKAADANDIQAQMYCAAAYLFGVGTKVNLDIAKRYYIAAAKNGNSIAQYTLADDFINSKHAENKKLGLIWLNKAVEQGNRQAQSKLGELYATGILVPKDIDKAKELFEIALAKGYTPALYQMGELARQQNDLPHAIDWYKKAASKNYAPAQISLARIYLQTKTPLYDPHTGFLWMLRAAQGGSSEAQLALSSIYKEGQVVARDDNLATEWQKRATNPEKGTSDLAQLKAVHWLTDDKISSFAASDYQLGGIFSAWHNPNALKQNNYNQAPQMNVITRADLYKPKFVMAKPNEIAISEYYDALANSLGGIQESGMKFALYPYVQYTTQEKLSPYIAIPTDEQSQLLAYDDSQGFNLSAFLSPMHEEPSKPKSMLAYLQSKAILGDNEAQFVLGQMYLNGIGVKKDTVEAMRFYQLAADQGDLRAKYTLGILYFAGQGIDPDYQQAQRLLEESAFKGDPHAQFALARIEEKGFQNASGEVLIAPNPEQAMSMYYLAADNNYGPAQYRLAETLVRGKQADISTAAKEKRSHLIKALYQGAVLEGIEQAALPLAFFKAMDSDPQKQTQAFDVAKSEASKGNGQAALLLGLMYDRGISVAADPGKAIYWYQQASLNPVSSFILGTYLSQGMGISQDIVKGRALLQKSADGGFSYGNLNLAVAKQQGGEAFVPELDEGLALGNTTAGLLLADYYLSQANDAQQMKQALDIYKQFAVRGDKEAQLKLAFMYQQGLGGAVDVASAQQWYSLAAGQGQPLAQFMLGQLNQLGWLSGQPDYVEAKKWYNSAKAKYAPAAVALGFIYDTVDDDYQQALADYQLAAQQGDPVGQFNLGLIYEKGKGYPVDFIKAKALYTQAANQGHSGAMVQLAGLNFNGLAGPRDQALALEWYNKAAALNDNDALYQLGLLSETGVATELNFVNAQKYYQESAAKGNIKAKLALARMYQYGLGVKKDMQQAVILYKEVAALSNPYAQYQLAAIAYEGAAGARSPDQGKLLLQQAQANGSKQASMALQWLDVQSSKEQLSYIEPASMYPSPVVAGQPADLMYLDALNEWNRGDEASSRLILRRIVTQFPQYEPAKRAYEQLHQQLTPSIFG